MIACVFVFLIGAFLGNQVSSTILSPTQHCILKDFSWKIKVKFLNHIFLPERNRRSAVIQATTHPNTTRNHLKNEESKERNVNIQFLTLRKNNVNLAKALKRNVAIDYLIKRPRKHVQRIDESSISFEEKSDSKNHDFDALGVHDGLQTDHNTDFHNNLVYRRQDTPESVSHHVEEAETDRDMKLKVFRLMYDTVKDNDALVRKADDIKKKYDNSSFFEMGFIMGAITDKVNTMSEVALTVERLYDEWKPIEHVNAYEQIANQAIEITHLVDLLQSAHKKVEATAKKEEKPLQRKLPIGINEVGNDKGIKDPKAARMRRARDLDRTL